MTIEKLTEAKRLQERKQRAEVILQLLEKAQNQEIQAKNIAEDDFITDAALYSNAESVRIRTYFFTKPEVEIIKKAFTNYINQLDTDFNLL